jgi:hypothetical protein
MELAACYHCGTWNFEVAPRFLENWRSSAKTNNNYYYYYYY